MPVNLIMFGPCIILQYICNPTRYTIFDDFIHNIQQLNMFRASVVHLQEHSYAACCDLVSIDTLWGWRKNCSAGRIETQIRISWNLIFSIYFRKILKYKISWKFVHWEQNCCMWKDRRLERHDGASKPHFDTLQTNLKNCQKNRRNKHIKYTWNCWGLQIPVDKF